MDVVVFAHGMKGSLARWDSCRIEVSSLCPSIPLRMDGFLFAFIAQLGEPLSTAGGGNLERGKVNGVSTAAASGR